MLWDPFLMKKLIKNEICGSMNSAHVHCSLQKVNICGYCSMNSNRKCWLSAVNSVHMHCLRTHKFHFLSIFSLKMGPTSLFTHLKIILLQCFQFSVFSFSKISSIQTHLKLVSYSKSFTHFHYSERFISIFFNLQVGEENLDSWMFW